MISISMYMDAHDIAQEIRLERQTHKGAFLLVEGIRDIRRFEKFTDPACSMVNCFGRHNLIEAIEMLYDEGFAGALGVADADFDRVTGELKVHEGVLYSEAHDFDLDWAHNSVLKRYLSETAEPVKLVALGGAEKVADFIMLRAKPLSMLRLINHEMRLRYNLKSLRHREFAPDAEVDVIRLVEHVSTGAFSSDEKKADLHRRIIAHARRDLDLRQITNGHDFLAMLGLALQNVLGSRAVPQTWGEEVELHFRLSYSEDDMLASTLFLGIIEWQDDNPPYLILKSSLVDRRLN